MISKLRFSLLAVVMLVLLGFGFQNQARAQVGLNGLFCPGVPDTTGYLETELIAAAAFNLFPDFSGALLGTVENSGGALVGGLDWQHVDNTLGSTSLITGTPTNETGSQLVSWWTQKEGRNTYLQVTNSSSSGRAVHVRIHNEDCVEIRDFCDFYTGHDTHEYNFGDLFSNGGADIGDSNLQGVEGWVVVTAITNGNCGDPGEQAFDHNFFSGQLIVHDSNDYLYGVNTYARQAICTESVTMDVGNLIDNGSFQFGDLSFWTPTSGNGPEENQVATEANWTPGNVPVPPNRYDSPQTGVVVITDNGGYNDSNFRLCADTTVAQSNPCEWPGNGAQDNSNAGAFINGGHGVLAQNFSRESIDGNTISGNIQLFREGSCNTAIAVVVYDTDTNPATVVDSECWANGNVLGPGNPTFTSFGNTNCTRLATVLEEVNLPLIEFEERSASIPWSLNIGSSTGNLQVQVIAGNSSGVPGDCNVAASFNNVFVQERAVDFCFGELDGRPNAKLDEFTPDFFYGQFNILPGNVLAGGDAVLINFTDFYGPPYRPLGTFVFYSVSLFDEHEVDQSCGDVIACFKRLGIDDAIVKSEDFVPPTLTPTTGPPTTPPITFPPVTPTSTSRGGGGGSSCAIAGNPVQLGTALANVLIPLVPVAFAFGVRAVRRRKK